MTILELLGENNMTGEEPAREVASMSNETYQRLCEERLDAEVREIVKRYQDSASDAWKYSVRGTGSKIPL